MVGPYTVVYIFKALGNPVWWSIGDCVGYILTEIVCGLSVYVVVYTYIQGRAVNKPLGRAYGTPQETS